MEEVRKYCAFISYRHKELDKYVAKKVHTMIERYTVPSELRKTWGSKKLGKVFRDEEELPVSSNLTDSITTALDNSDFLIVICTPDTPESIWVEREIGYFLEHHDRSHVIGVLANGTPDEAFPKLLTNVYDEEGNVAGEVEPLAANLTGVDHKFKKSRMHKECVRLYAAIMGCHFDSLWQREKRHNMKCAMALMGVVAAVALWYCISIYLKNQRIEEQNERISEQYEQIEAQNDEISKQFNEIKEKNGQIEAQNAEIRDKYEDIRNKNRELKEKEAGTLISEGELLLEKGNLEEAGKCAIKAISSEEGRVLYADEAQYLLSRVLAACRYDNYMRTTAVIEQEDNIAELLLSENGELLYTMDERGYVRCFSTDDGSLKWRGDAVSHNSHSYAADRERLIAVQEYGILLCVNKDAIAAISLENGLPVWNYKFSYTFNSDFFVLSPDKTKIAVIDTVSNFGTVDGRVLLLNTEDGSIIKELPIGDAFEGHSMVSSGRQSGVFLPDGKTVVGMIYYNDSLVNYDSACLIKIDYENEKIDIINKTDVPEEWIPSQVYSFVIGMEYIPEHDAVLMFHYDSWEKKLRAQEITLGGEMLKDYEFAMSMPVRELSGEYSTTYKRSGDSIRATCGQIAFVYNLAENRFVTLRSGINSNIYYSECINEDAGMYVYLTADGRQYVYLDNGGKMIGPFSDKIELAGLVITEGYAINREGGFGIELSPTAVEAAVGNNDLKKAYILRPDKDAGYETAECYAGKIESGYFYRSSLSCLNTGELVFKGWNGDDDILYITVTDPVTGETKAEYKVDAAGYGLPGAGFLVSDSFIWPDGKHFSYNLDTLPSVYDMETATVTKIFGDAYPKAAAYSIAENGDILAAAICNTEGSSILDQLYEIRWTLGSGEVQKVALPEDKMSLYGDGYLKKSYFYVGSNGIIIVALHAKDDAVTDSFYLVDTSEGTGRLIENSEMISPEGKTAFGKHDKIFAATGNGRELKMYSVTGEQLGSIEIAGTAQDISSMEFILDDTAVAVWIKSRILYVYDIKTRSCIYEGIFKSENSSGAKDPTVSSVEDPEHDRIFFVTSEKAVIMVNTQTWEKQADFAGFDAYCLKTGDIYRIKNSGIGFSEEDDSIIKVKAYTLSELEERMIKEEEKD
ncbi:MAG: TIR domain-containing protein [Lachnospiraceae bacterium]|nr:TIR domain-containing protein [Lachnospiraceae bacterium]